MFAVAQELPEGTVTILFTDVVGSTELTNRLGDDVARQILGSCDDLVRRQIGRHRGQEVKGTGDGLMVAFTSARRAIACAVDIQEAMAARRQREPERGVAVKIGLNTGEVIREEADLFGAMVTAAARIADHASAGEILVSDAVRAVLGSATPVQLEDKGDVELRGFPDPWRLHAVRWEQETALPALFERTPFVGREEERSVLRRLLDEAIRGEGSLMMIGGEAGIGKTRLAEEAAAEARQRGFLTLVGHCYEMEGAPPYIPFVEALQAAARMASREALREDLGDAAPAVARLVPELHRTLPDIGPPLGLPPEEERHYVFNDVLEFLRRTAQREPIFLMLEDLHWADESTLLLLRHIAPCLSQMPALIVGTYRDVELDVDRPLAQALAELHRYRLAHRLSLGRLGQAEVSSMIEGLSGQEPPSGLVRVVWSAAEGTPFFVEELLRHLLAEGGVFDEEGRLRTDMRTEDLVVPEGVRLLAVGWLRRVSEETGRLLAEASILGSSFSLEVLQATAGMESDDLLDAIDEAERAHLVATSSSDGSDILLAFTHDLIRQALVDRLSLPRRQRLHLKVAETIERLGPPGGEEHVSSLAYHYRSAGGLADPGRVAAACRAAGDLALRMKAYPEAEAEYLAALGAGPQPRGLTTEERAAVLHKLGQVYRGQGRWDEAVASFDEAIDLWGGPDSGRAPADLFISKADALAFRPLPQLLEALDALAVARRSVGADKWLQCRITELEAQHFVQLRRYAEAEVAAEQAFALADEIDSNYLRARVLMASGLCHLFTLDVGRAVEEYSRVLEMGETTVHQRMASQSRCALALASVGRLDEAAERGSVAQQYFRCIPEPAAEPDAKYLVGELDPAEYGIACLPTVMVAVARGRFDEAFQLVEQCLEESGDPPSIGVMMSLLPMRVALCYYRGRLDDADELVRGFVASFSGGQARVPAVAHAYRGLLDAAGGADAGTVAETLAPVSMRFRPDVRSLPVHVLVAEIAVLTRHASLAAGRYEVLQELYRGGVLFTLPWVSLLPRLLGSIAILQEDWGEAERYLDQAAEVAQSAGAAPEVAFTQLELAELCANLPGEARRSAARAHLTEAESLLSELGIVACDRRLAGVERPLSGLQSARRRPEGLADEDT